MSTRTSKGSTYAVIAILLILLAYVLYMRFHKPHAHTGTTTIETDSSIIEVTVVESLDSAGNVQYETIRKSTPKP